MGRTQRPICTCMGCAGAKGQRSKAHEGKCSKFQQTEVQYGSYCKSCYANHLCIRCEINAVHENIVGDVCQTCIDEMPRTERPTCTCKGCSGSKGQRGKAHAGQCSSYQKNGILVLQELCA